MGDEITKKINQLVLTELSKYPNAGKDFNISLKEEDEDEDGGKRNKPEDYLIDPEDMKKIYLLAKNKKLSVNKIREKIPK